MSGDGSQRILGEEVLHVLGEELQSQPVLPGTLGHRHHEGRPFGALHDRPHLVHDQQARLGVLGGGLHCLSADHRGGGPQLGFEEAQVEDRHQSLVAEEVVALVGEKVSKAAGGEGPQQPREVGIARLALLQIRVEVAEAGAP